jgi:lysosomal acid lipase/cholesteryl ester hydrolase
MWSTLLLSLLGGILHPDVWRNTTALAEAYGYMHETHTVTTKDGYILTLFRIPGKQGEDLKAGPRKVPLVIQHGIIVASDNLLIAGPPYAPGFFFVDQGFDVWLPDSRGNTYSREHVNYTVNDKEFWDFTFEDLGVYDQPAYLDYVSMVTGFEKVHFMGHSQGGTQMWAALTLDPEYYAGRLRSFVSLGAVSRLDTTRSSLVRLFNNLHMIETADYLAATEMMNYNQPFGLLLSFVGTYMPAMMLAGLKLACDDFPESGNLSRSAVFMSHYPQGTSLKSLKHLQVLLKNPGFYRYRAKPTDPLVPYDLSEIPNIPIALLGGEGDTMAAPDAVLWFHDQLNKHRKRHFMRIYPAIGHLTMLAPNNDNVKHLYDMLHFMRSVEEGDFPHNLH